MTNRLWWLLLLAALTLGQTEAQTHFSPVSPTGLPYAVVLDSVRVDHQPLIAGDEVGVFDNELCVGATVSDGSEPVSLTVWQGDPSMSLEGFTPGHTMLFRVWRTATGEEIEGDATFSEGDGTFGYGAFSRGWLDASSVEVPESGHSTIPAIPLLVHTYPNPFNARVTIDIETARPERISVEVYDCLGRSIARLASRLTINDRSRLTWRPNLPSGTYFLQVTSTYGSATTTQLHLLR